MKVSPCGWFCFEEPAGWVITDTTESILLNHPPSRAVMEVTSARKDHRVRESEVWNILEASMAAMPGADIEETSMYRLPCGCECLKSVQALGNMMRGMVFIFWSNYCVQIRIRAITESFRIDDCLRGLNDLINSVQPLTTD